MEVIGWLGSILLSLCGLPEAYRTWRDKRCYAGWGLLIMWYLGEVCFIIFEFSGEIRLQRLGNYILNFLIVGYLMYYKVKNMKERKQQRKLKGKR